MIDEIKKINLENIRAVIWDMDGVIIDTENFWPQAERNAFTKLGVPSTADFENATTGLRPTDVILFWYKLYPWNLQKNSYESVREEIISQMLNFIEHEGKILKNIDDLMDFFQSKNIKQAIASSSPAAMIQKVLDKLNLNKYIQSISSGEDELHGKPAPDVYLTAAKKLALNPNQCLVIEDSYNGAIAGQRAGMQILVIPSEDTFNDQEKMQKFKKIPGSIIVNKDLVK